MQCIIAAARYRENPVSGESIVYVIINFLTLDQRGHNSRARSLCIAKNLPPTSMSLSSESPITRWLKRVNGFSFTLYATLMAFCCYTCVYAFRKTFSVATFDGLVYAGISYKVWLVTFR